jgi:TonB-dependent starch-binding outer membrane protein SusC
MRKLILSCTLLLCLFGANAQTTRVAGKITDANGAQIPAATIIEKGTKNGTVASADGTFSLMVTSSKAVLVISALGFETAEIPAGSGPLSVKLGIDTKTLTEVVVTGTGVATSKKKLGISVESVTADKLPQIPAATLDQALVGKIPGAQISSVSGNPGDKVNIVLRGINTIQGGTRPLVMMDGVEIPFENLTTLNLGQVERIEVVQGAASASIYGAQGANGVIQIFSKKGVKGRLSIDVSSSYANNSFINSGNFGKADKHPYLTDNSGNIVYQGTNADLGYTAGEPITVDPTLGIILGSNSISYRYGSNITNSDLPDPSVIPGLSENYTRYGILDPRNKDDQAYTGSLHYYDHFKQVFQSAASLNNAINVSGGGEKMDFNFALSNNRTNSPLLKDNGYLDRTNATLNLGVELFKNFTVRSITNMSYSKNTMNPRLGAPGGAYFGLGKANAEVGGVYGFLNTSPFFSLMDTIEGGHYASFQRASFLSVNAFNPFYRLEYTDAIGKRYDLIQDLEANYKVNKFVNLNAKYGITYKNENDIWTIYNQSLNANTEDQGSWASWYGTDETGEIDNYQYNNTKQNFTGSATIKTDFEKDFNIHFPLQTNTLLAYDYRKNDYKEYDTWAQTLPFNPPFNFGAAQSVHLATANTDGTGRPMDYQEVFVTYGYVFDQRLDFGNYGGITGGFRTDYSSAFGAGSKPFTFPHFNGYVNLASFNFWNGLSNTLPYFKLRAAYGKAGIQPGPFDRYPVLTQQPTGSETSYTNPPNINNPNLNVEVSSETEGGFDMSVNIGKGDWFKSVNISGTYWKRHTDNAIYYQNLPPSTGATQILTNAIELSSHGWQLAFDIPVLTSPKLTWNLTLNFGHQTSMIDNVTGGDIPITSGAGDAGLVLAAGRKIGEIYGYKALTSVSAVRADGKTPFIDPSAQGDYEIVEGRVVNKTTKAIYFSDEATSLGDPNPTLTSSFINTLTWKNTISLGFQLDWIDGSHLYNQTDEWMYRDGISSDFTKPVTINGETGAWTAYYASAYYALGSTAKGVGNNVTKNYFYYGASFLRLRNVSLGVDFATFAKKDWLKKCQIILSGRNLFTVTNYPGMDPEISSGSSNSAFDRGIDHNTIPNLKSYQVTLNLGF